MQLRKARSRLDTIRQCERDMRCVCRDMQERRILMDRLEKMLRAKSKGRPYNEILLARIKHKKARLDMEIPERWERLHNRMDRDRARRERIMGSKGATNGKRANG
jgi:hypothetical protein